MQFDEKKLGVEAIDQLLQCHISSVEPYALMLAPIYIFMKLNQKLVSVKAPLDFFTPDELHHLSRYENFYIPKFVQSGSRFQTAAKLVRNLTSSNPTPSKLAPTSYELSNEVILTLATLWGRDLSIDPFYSAVFADELLGPLDPEKMLAARDLAVTRHDSGILLSGLITFVLLHLGFYDLSLISAIRVEVYESIVERDENWQSPSSEWQVVARDLKQVVAQYLCLNTYGLKEIHSEWAHKLLGRISRISTFANLKAYPSVHFSEVQEVSA
jgi:hypothetical protein